MYLIFFSSKCKDSDSENPDVICNGRGKFWQYGLSRFQGRDTKLNRFLAKNQCTLWYLLYFVNRNNAELSKWAKIWLSTSIFNIRYAFFLWNVSLNRRTFFLLTFFDNFTFQQTLFWKMMPNVWRLGTMVIHKLQ